MTKPHRWSFPVGRVLGIEVRVHVSFLILVVLFALAAPQPGVSGALQSVGWLIVIFACVVVHELAHCVVARQRGAHVGEILLFPLGGVSKLHDLPESPRDEFAIAIVGPLTSIGLGVLAGALCVVTGGALFPPDLIEAPFLARLAWLNIILGGFNLLPAFPLDGGRVLRSLLERGRDLEQATRMATRVGHALAVGLMIVGFFLNAWLLLIGLFVYFGASAEEAATIVHFRLRGHRVRDAMVSIAALGRAPAAEAPTVDVDALLDDELLELVQATPGHALLVAEHGTVVGVLRVEDIVHLVQTTGPVTQP